MAESHAGMKKHAVFIYSEDQLGYKFSDTHPFNQKRLILTIDLLREMDALPEDLIVPARTATDEELLLAHDQRYIDIVKKASRGEITPEPSSANQPANQENSPYAYCGDKQDVDAYRMC